MPPQREPWNQRRGSRIAACMEDEARPAFLFQCGEKNLFAVTRDATGGILPSDRCLPGWQLRRRFLLGPKEPPPFSMDPGSILQGIHSRGYYIWRGRLHWREGSRLARPPSSR